MQLMLARASGEFFSVIVAEGGEATKARDNQGNIEKGKRQEVGSPAERKNSSARRLSSASGEEDREGGGSLPS